MITLQNDCLVLGCKYFQTYLKSINNSYTDELINNQTIPVEYSCFESGPYFVDVFQLLNNHPTNFSANSKVYSVEIAIFSKLM